MAKCKMASLAILATVNRVKSARTHRAFPQPNGATAVAPLDAMSLRLQESLRDARSSLAADQLTQARRVLGEANKEIGSDREALGNLANEIETLDLEVARLEWFFSLIDEAFNAETPHADAELLRAGDKEAVELRGEARVPSAAAPLLLQALSVYGVMEQEDWSSALESSLLAPKDVQRIRQVIYEALLWLADNLVVRHADYQTGRELSAESAARLALGYVEKAETAHLATPALFRIRAACARLLHDEKGALADEQRARQTPAALALDHYLLGLRAISARDKKEAVAQFEAALRLEPSHYWSLMFLGVSLVDLGQEQDWAAAVWVFTGGIMKWPEHFAAYGLRGNAYKKLHRYDQALADFSKSIELKPTAVALTSRGSVFRALHKLNEARADHESAIRLQPGDAKAHVNLGTVHLNEGRLDQAVKEYETAIRLKPDLFEAHASLGDAFGKMRRFDQAIAEFEKAVRLRPNEARLHHHLGIALCDGKRDYDRAIREFKEAIRLDPQEGEDYHASLGDAFWKMRRFDQAIAEFEKAVRLQPNEAYFHHRLGIVWCDGKSDYDRAIREFKEAIRLDPQEGSFHLNLGQAFRHKGLIDDAIAAYREAIRLNPDFARAHNLLGVGLQAKGQLDQAVAEFEEAIRKDSKYADPHINLGAYWCDKRHDYRRAVAEFKEAIRLNPDEPNAHFNMGIALQKSGRVQQAIAEFERTLRLKADYPFAHLNLGRALRGQREFAQAVVALREAIRLQPEEADAHNDLGGVLFDQGRFQEAEAAFREAIRLVPKRSLYHSNRGNALFGLGRFSEVDSEHRESLRLEPESANVHNQAAWFHANCPDGRFRDPQRAVELAKKAVALAPKDGDCWNTLGVAHYRAGDYQAALTALQKSMELRAGGDSGDWFFLAMAYWKRGEKEKAREWYGKAVQWMENNRPNDGELRRFRTEAGTLLGVKEKELQHGSDQGASLPVDSQQQATSLSDGTLTVEAIDNSGR
jgi:tetratricopeptide (TPR) repeat protein